MDTKIYLIVVFSLGVWGCSGGGGDGELDAGSGPDSSVGSGEGEACDDANPCRSSFECVTGECVIPGAACASDPDCQGDSYCCIEDCLPAGTTDGFCISYGDGPRGDTNDECLGDIAVGIFQADTQCEWVGPPQGDAFPEHVQVLSTPMVAELIDGYNDSAEIAVMTYNYTDGGSQSAIGSDPAYYGVLRILDGQSCEQLATLDDPANRMIGATPPAIADLNGGGPEIVVQRANSGLVAFTWTGAEWETLWVATGSDIDGAYRWDGPAIHDLNDDGLPEVISAGEVFDGVSGARLNPGQNMTGDSVGSFSILADLNGDNTIELVADDVYSWNAMTNRWELLGPGVDAGLQFAVADFGTPGATPADFDGSALDGIAEIVSAGGNQVQMATIEGQVILSSTSGILGGGPPTIGDFDNDGFPEIATAGGNFYRVLDLDCEHPGNGCEGGFVRWSRTSQDLSSRRTGSSIFDFDGDGQAEAVYADECFSRIYDGNNGDVLYSSFRTSCTWLENPVIADPDRDENTEIIIGSNSNCGISCPAIDPIHPGTTCEDAADCLSGVCDEGLCRCAGPGDCDDGYDCVGPLATSAGAGDVCRAAHPPGVGSTGVRVLRDRLDRWASSRPLWNQHAYSVTNINDDLTTPSTSAWEANQSVAGLNNFRQNTQGAAAAGDLPDITGSIDPHSACISSGNSAQLSATVCNRGKRAVGAAMPATFYAGSVAPENVVCVSYTSGAVPVGGCLEVTCDIGDSVEGEIVLVVNDDGEGGRATVECIDDNNTDRAEIDACVVID